MRDGVPLVESWGRQLTKDDPQKLTFPTSTEQSYRDDAPRNLDSYV